MNSEIVISGKKSATLNKIFRNILIANILGWVVYVLATFADSVIGGTFIGETAVAAIEIVTPVSAIIFCASYLVSVGCGLLHAKYIGKNDFERADRIFSSGFFFGIACGIVLAGLLLACKEWWLSLYNLDDELKELASSYYDPFILMALITPLGVQIYTAMVSDGDAKYCLISDVAQSAIIIPLSIILINTSVGIAGLSISTFVGTFIGYSIPVLRFFNKSNTLRIKFKFSFVDIFNSIKLGVPTFLTLLATAFVDIVMNLFISSTWGAAATAPYTLVNFGLEIASALAMVGSAMLTLLNFAVGEDNMIDVKAIIRIAKKMAFIVGFGFTVMFVGLTPVWPSLFGITTPDFVAYVTTASIAIGLTFVPSTYFFLVCNYYPAYEKVGLSVATNILNSLVFPLLVPIALTLLFGNNYHAFVIGFALSNLLSFGGTYLFLAIKNKGIVFEIPETNSQKYSLDLIIEEQSISESVRKISDIFNQLSIDPIISSRAQITIEESLNITLKNNKKKIYGRIVLDINDERIKIIVKDSGKIFDVVNPDQKVEDLSNFVYVMASSKSAKAINYVSSNLNGNHYEFNLKH